MARKNLAPTSVRSQQWPGGGISRTKIHEGQVVATTTTETTIAVPFDLEPGHARNLWSVLAGMPCERALLDAWVLCIGLKDRLTLASTGAPLGGDLARAYTFSATSAQALLDASLPAYAGNRSVTRLLLEATQALEYVVERLASAEEAQWVAVEGEEAVTLARLADAAAAASLEARELVQTRARIAEAVAERVEGLRPAA